MAFDDLGKGLAAVCNPMTRDKTTNPGEIAADLERLKCDRHNTDAHCRAADCDARSNLASTMVRNAATIIAALRAAGEVERMREALEEIAEATHDGYDFNFLRAIARRALAGSATPANQRDANNDR